MCPSKIVIRQKTVYRGCFAPTNGIVEKILARNIVVYHISINSAASKGAPELPPKLILYVTPTVQRRIGH